MQIPKRFGLPGASPDDLKRIFATTVKGLITEKPFCFALGILCCALREEFRLNSFAAKFEKTPRLLQRLGNSSISDRRRQNAYTNEFPNPHETLMRKGSY